MSSIRRQLTWKLLLGVVSCVSIGLAAIILTARHELLESFDVNLRTRALAVTALTEVEDGRVAFDFSPDFLRGFDGPRPRHYFEVWTAEGRPLARSPSLGLRDLALGAVPTDRPAYRDVDFPDGRPARMIEIAYRAQGAPASQPGPPLVIEAASDRTELDETLNEFLGVAAACAALLYVGVIWWVPRVLTREMAPLADLASRAGSIGADNLGDRFRSEGLPAELGPIAVRLNELLARLEQSFDNERRFSADLAHELRTPLAELRSMAECAMKWPDERNEGWERDVLAVSAQMEALVTRMLALARSESGQILVNVERIEPASVAREAWKPFETRAAARGIRPMIDLSDGAAMADRVLLQSVLSNLFDNAVEYAPLGSELRVSCTETSDGFSLRVSNPASEITAQDIPRLFERFWRKEAARSGGGQHVGLGLSLARSFGASMGWTLGASLSTEGWIVFNLTGPSAP